MVADTEKGDPIVQGIVEKIYGDGLDLTGTDPEEAYRLGRETGERLKWTDLIGIDPDYGETEGMELNRLRGQVERIKALSAFLKENGAPVAAAYIDIMLEEQ